MASRAGGEVLNLRDKIVDWLGLGDTSPNAPTVDGEMGAAGTPIFSGFLREFGEYNPTFAGGPFTAFRLYEQMRRSDAQVAGTLMACKLPIRGAEWAISVPDDASPVEKEAAEFVEEQLFDAVDFEAALENALLMFDFGCAAHEDVWQIDADKNRVGLKRLAPRLPLTFYRWLTKPGTDELAALGQLGYRGGEYVHAEVPAEKLALFTFQQEGANFAGRSLTRAMYQHWFTKQGLYVTDAIACERNGMGVPVITMGPSPSTEDKRLARTWVQQLTAHERTGLVLPDGWTFKLEGVTGTLRDPKDAIAHHNMQIAMSALAQFMVMGQGTHGSGNRSLGDTMSDFFLLGLQATANHIGRVFSATTIKRLVDLNFERVENYPVLVPQQIITSKLETIVEALAKLGTANMVSPDPDMESWLREKMGAPKKVAGAAEPDVLGDDPESGIGGDPDAAAAAAVPPGPVAGKKKAPAAPPAAAEEKAAMSTLRLVAVDMGSLHIDTAMGARRPEKRVAGSVGSEAARRAEKCVAFSAIAGELDRGRDEIAAALRAARSRVQAGVVQKLMAAPLKNAHRVSIEPDVKLVAAVESAIRGVYEFGARTVNEERARQKAGAGPSDAAQVRLAAAAGKRDALGLYADATVSEFQNSLTARAANVALDYRRRQGELTDGEVIRSIEDDLDGQSDKWIDGVASKGANEAFADGRNDGYEAHKDEIGSVIYSAMLDPNTCEACADADGDEGATPDDIAGVPNPDCDGGDKCRCVHVYVFSDEGEKAA